MRRLALAVALATVVLLATGLAAGGTAPTGLQQNDTAQDDETRPRGTFDVQCTELRCSFDARDVELENATVSEYAWDFGDGDTTTGPRPRVNHTYSRPGTYNVTLTLTTEDGETHNRTQAVEIVTNRPEQGEVPWMGLAVGVGSLLGSLLLARAT